MDINNFVKEFNDLNFEVIKVHRHLINIYNDIQISKEGRNILVYRIKLKLLVKFFNEKLNNKKWFSKENFNISHAINEINLLQNEDSKLLITKELFQFFDKNKAKISKSNETDSNLDLDISQKYSLDKSMNDAKNETKENKYSNYINLGKYLDVENDILKFNFIDWFNDKLVLYESKYNNIKFKVFYKGIYYYAKVNKNVLLFFDNETLYTEDYPSIYILLKEYDIIISKNESNRIKVNYFNKFENHNDSFDIVLKNETNISDSLNFKDIYESYRSIINAILYESNDIYSIKEHPIGKIQITIKLLSSIGDKDCKYYFSNGYNLKLNLKFINYDHNKIFFIPIYNVFQKINLKFINKTKTVNFKIRINNILNDFGSSNNVYCNNYYKIEIKNYSKPIKHYFEPYPEDDFDGISQKKSISESRKMMKLVYFRLKRFKIVMDKNIKSLQYLLFFRFPLLSYIIHGFNLYCLLFFSMIKIAYIIILLYMVFKFVYNSNQSIMDSLFKKYFKENIFYKEPILKSIIIKDNDKFYDFKNFENFDDENKTGFFKQIKKIYKNINKIPIFFAKIISFMEKLKNLFNFTDKKKTLFVYMLLFLIYIIFSYLTVNFVLIITTIIIVITKRKFYEKNYKRSKFIFENEINIYFRNKKYSKDDKLVLGEKFSKVFSEFLEDKFQIFTEPAYWDKFKSIEEIIDQLSFSTYQVWVKDSFYYNDKFKYILYNFICSTQSDYYSYLNLNN